MQAKIQINMPVIRPISGLFGELQIRHVRAANMIYYKLHIGLGRQLVRRTSDHQQRSGETMQVLRIAVRGKHVLYPRHPAEDIVHPWMLGVSAKRHMLKEQAELRKDL